LRTAEQIREVFKTNNITGYRLEKDLKVTQVGADKFLNGETKNPYKSTLVMYNSYIDNNFKSIKNVETVKELIKKNAIANPQKEKKVPYYDIDVTSSIVSSFSDVIEEPAFYVDYKPFNDCTAYVNNFGDSMFPKYKNGERLAVKQITNFDVLNWGETYLVITNGNANDLKTVKDVHPHDDFNKVVLRASNPAYKGDTPINKEDIIAMFAVKGKISQNFI
jgi:phage repressor protein C with HTH and peptisase S24 domain